MWDSDLEDFDVPTKVRCYKCLNSCTLYSPLNVLTQTPDIQETEDARFRHAVSISQEPSTSEGPTTSLQHKFVYVNI